MLSEFIYDLILSLYHVGIKLSSFRNKKAKKWLEGRKNLIKNLEETLPKNEKRIWFHAASLGEFEQGRTLIEKIKKNNPNAKILLSFFSPSGYEIRKNYTYADYVVYLPLDGRATSEDFIRIVNPSLVFFIKYEYWYYYFKTLKRKKIPLYILSGIFRKEQVFFKWYGGFYRKMLHCVSHFFVQDSFSENLLNSRGFGNTTVAPDTRIDRAAELPNNIIEDEIINDFLQGEKAIVGGSIYEQECEMLKEVFLNNNKQKLILVPHNVEEKSIQKIIKIFPEANLYTSYAERKKSNVLIVNKIGLLASIYAKGSVAIVGGGFGKGIHNVLEPASFGLPILFGPNYHKFKEAKELINCNAAFEFMKPIELSSLFTKISGNESNYGESGSGYIRLNKGGTIKIFQYIKINNPSILNN